MCEQMLPNDEVKRNYQRRNRQNRSMCIKNEIEMEMVMKVMLFKANHEYWVKWSRMLFSREHLSLYKSILTGMVMNRRMKTEIKNIIVDKIDNKVDEYWNPNFENSFIIDLRP